MSLHVSLNNWIYGLYCSSLLCDLAISINLFNMVMTSVKILSKLAFMVFNKVGKPEKS